MMWLSRATRPLAVLALWAWLPFAAQATGPVPRPADPIPPPVRPASAASAAPTVGIMGNSISWQSYARIRHHVGRNHEIVYFDAIIGGTIAGQRPSLVAAVRAPGGPDIVLIEMGTNDAGQNHSLEQFTIDVRRTLDAISPHVDAVVWFDLKNQGSAIYPDFNRNAGRFNRRLHDIADDYPKVVIGHYADWADAVGPRAFDADLIHLSPSGEDGLGRFMAQAATGFDPRLRTGAFWDVADAHWASAAIAACAAEGAVSGYSNGSYHATAGSHRFTVTRAQWLNMLWRHAGATTGHPPAPWSDVPRWIEQAAAWAWASGTARGYPDGTLRPTVPPSRAAAASTLHRLNGSPPTDALPPHGLVDVPAWAEKAVRWAVAVGVMTGYRDGTFRPYEPVTREQASVFLHRSGAVPAGPDAGAGQTVPPSTTAPATAPTSTIAPPPGPPSTPLPSTPSTSPATSPADSR